jgi:Fe-Mn family superoxide dismutase
MVETKKRSNKLVLEKLPYKISDLAPILSQDNVEYHYNVLSNGYVDRYNNREGDPDFNYGGAMLHNIFWQQLQAPKGTNRPTGAIKELIEEKHKSFAEFLDVVIIKSMSIQGSGWVYLSTGGDIKTIANHAVRTDICVLVDWWEHVWATDYQWDKERYLDNIWKIIDWDVCNERL